MKIDEFERDIRNILKEIRREKKVYKWGDDWDEGFLSCLCNIEGELQKALDKLRNSS